MDDRIVVSYNLDVRKSESKKKNLKVFIYTRRTPTIIIEIKKTNTTLL